jgi:hypothetical protein
MPRHQDEVRHRFLEPEDTKLRRAAVGKELAQAAGWDGYSAVVVDEHDPEIARRAPSNAVLRPGGLDLLLG